MNSVSDYLFMGSLAVLVIGVMASGLAFNPFRMFGKGRQILDTQGAGEGLFKEEPPKKPRLRKIPLSLMIVGVAGILVSVGVSYI